MDGAVDNRPFVPSLTPRIEKGVRAALSPGKATQFFSAVTNRVHFWRWGAALRLCACVSILILNAQAAQPGKLPKNAVPGEMVVKFKAGVTDAQIEHGIRVGKLKLKRHLQTELMHQAGDEGLILAESDDAAENVIARLSNHAAIEYVEPNLRYTHQAVSNDSYVSGGYLWGMYGDVGTPANRYGSQAVEAWSAGYTGSSSIYVAVIDEGIEVTHPELAANIWTNPFDPADGIDNDGNGYIDDVNGWDFAANNNVVFDASGDEHGTHVAGTIGAKG